MDTQSISQARESGGFAANSRGALQPSGRERNEYPVPVRITRYPWHPRAATMYNVQHEYGCGVPWVQYRVGLNRA